MVETSLYRTVSWQHACMKQNDISVSLNNFVMLESASLRLQKDWCTTTTTTTFRTKLLSPPEEVSLDKDLVLRLQLGCTKPSWGAVVLFCSRFKLGMLMQEEQKVKLTVWCEHICWHHGGSLLSQHAFPGLSPRAHLCFTQWRPYGLCASLWTRQWRMEMPLLSQQSRSLLESGSDDTWEALLQEYLPSEHLSAEELGADRKSALKP